MDSDSDIDADFEIRPRYCRVCGAGLQAEGDRCESCGAAIPIPSKPHTSPVSYSSETITIEDPTQPSTPAVKIAPVDIVQALYNPSLPDPSVSPNLSRALGLGWAMLMDDVVGGIISALLYVAVSGASSIVYIIGPIVLGGPLMVGFMGWAEARRQGLPGGQGAIFNVGFKYFSSAFLVSLVAAGAGLVVTLPILISMFSGLLMSSQSTPSPFNPFNPVGPSPSNLFTGMFGILYISVIGLALLFSPMLVAILGMASWAITRGVPFKPAFGWGWQRFWRYPLQWWWAALVINLVAALGVFVCYIGMLFSLPWAALATAEIVGNEGEFADESFGA